MKVFINQAHTMTMFAAVLIFILIISTITAFTMPSSNTFQFSISSLSHSAYLPVIAQGQEEEPSTQSSELENNVAGSGDDDTSTDDQEETKNLNDLEEIGVHDDQNKTPAEEREVDGTIPKPDYPSDCPSGSRYEVFPPPRGKECLPCIPDVDPDPECSGSTNSRTPQQQEDQIGQQEQSVDNPGFTPGDPIPDIG